VSETWREPDFESAASISHWRRQMARLLCVEAAYLDAWDVEQFMRWVAAERARVVAPPAPAEPGEAGG
jgi:hypothetical protein